MPAAHRQGSARIRFEQGLTGGLAIAEDVAAVVVVDVLSFTTAVGVVLDGGGRVWPCPWDDDERATALALQHDAVLAVGRSRARAAGGVSLSPVSLRAASPQRLVLPSPNGSRLCAELAGRAPVVVAACLRNAAAVARWLTDLAGGVDSASVAVVAAGERWPDGSLRPAVEDVWGAGAVVDRLVALGWTGLSQEARAARAASSATQDDVGSALLECSSGAELVAAGHRGDVLVAAEPDTSDRVPVLRDGCLSAG